MKKILLLLLILPFFACSDDEKEPTQDYTSFILENRSGGLLSPCVLGYLEDDGNWIKIADLGNVDPVKDSKEVKLEYIEKDIYIFAQVLNNILTPTQYLKMRHPVKLKKNEINRVQIDERDYEQKPIDAEKLDPNNPKEYPQ